VPRYLREDIHPGVYLTLDAPVDTPIRMSTRPQPPPVRYGDEPPDFSEVNDRLDEVAISRCAQRGPGQT